MGRAQFRDTAMLSGSSGGLTVAPSSASIAVYDVGTSNPITDILYADDSSSITLGNPMPVGANGMIDFWTADERELDVVVTCPGFAVQRVTVTTDAASGAGGTTPGVDTNLRIYVQHIMSVIDPGNAPPPGGP